MIISHLNKGGKNEKTFNFIRHNLSYPRTGLSSPVLVGDDSVWLCKGTFDSVFETGKAKKISLDVTDVKPKNDNDYVYLEWRMSQFEVHLSKIGSIDSLYTTVVMVAVDRLLIESFGKKELWACCYIGHK